VRPFLVSEGPSGILSLRFQGAELPAQYVPDCDLDKTLAMLMRFYGLRAANGKTLKENYRERGFNWFSTRVGFLYWRACYRLVQYGPLLSLCLEKNLRPVFRGSGNFSRLWAMLHGKKERSLTQWWRYERRLPRHNRRVVEQNRGGLLFYRYGPKDFRSREMLEHFQARGVPLVQTFTPSLKRLQQARQQDHPSYVFYRPHARENAFGHEYDLSGLEPLERRLARAVIPLMEEDVTAMLRQYERYLEDLALLRPQAFFGLDDHNMVYPMLYACRELGVPTIGYQLGMYSRLQAAYTLEGWEPGEYDWYDHVICWGRYWEDVIRKHSRAYPEGFFLQGTNKLKLSYQRLESEDFHPRNVLVPFEFFANTHKNGLYLRALMDNGFRVHLKLRPDQPPAAQMASYLLPPEYRERVVPVYEITDELMARMNVVAGSMSTLLFDLLPYGKETWVFDTEFGLLRDMVEDGFARLVRLEDIPRLEPPARADKRMDYAYLFNDMSLGQALDRHVLPRMRG
jgi:hypothetical protein